MPDCPDEGSIGVKGPPVGRSRSRSDRNSDVADVLLALLGSLSCREEWVGGIVMGAGTEAFLWGRGNRVESWTGFTAGT